MSYNIYYIMVKREKPKDFIVFYIGFNKKMPKKPQYCYTTTDGKPAAFYGGALHWDFSTYNYRRKYEFGEEAKRDTEFQAFWPEQQIIKTCYDQVTKGGRIVTLAEARELSLQGDLSPLQKKGIMQGFSSLQKVWRFKHYPFNAIAEKSFMEQLEIEINAKFQNTTNSNMRLGLRYATPVLIKMGILPSDFPIIKALRLPAKTHRELKKPSDSEVKIITSIISRLVSSNKYYEFRIGGILSCALLIDEFAISYIEQTKTCNATSENLIIPPTMNRSWPRFININPVAEIINRFKENKTSDAWLFSKDITGNLRPSANAITTYFYHTICYARLKKSYGIQDVKHALKGNGYIHV
jgi:hypothetical protein